MTFLNRITFFKSALSRNWEIYFHEVCNIIRISPWLPLSNNDKINNLNLSTNISNFPFEPSWELYFLISGEAIALKRCIPKCAPAGRRGGVRNEPLKLLHKQGFPPRDTGRGLPPCRPVALPRGRSRPGAHRTRLGSWWPWTGQAGGPPRPADAPHTLPLF